MNLMIMKTPSHAWFRFCQEPANIHEYECTPTYSMNDLPVPNGCTYVFKGGWLAGNTCDSPLVEGKNRCAFHDHPIFSETVRNAIKQVCEEIDALPPHNKLIVHPWNIDSYREQKHGLIINYSGALRICTGYVAENNGTGKAEPLTPELRAYCLEHGLVIAD